VCVCVWGGGRNVECRSDIVDCTELNCVSVCVCMGGGRNVECRSDIVDGTEVNCVSVCV